MINFCTESQISTRMLVKQGSRGGRSKVQGGCPNVTGGPDVSRGGPRHIRECPSIVTILWGGSGIVCRKKDDMSKKEQKNSCFVYF